MNLLELTSSFTNNNITRSAINAFEEIAKASPHAHIELKVKHHFSHGVYARELHIPKGVILTGKIHKYPQLNIMIKGVIEVLVGDKIERIEAPFTIVSPAGTKRIARVLEDVIWTTIHGTDETDIDKIENYFIAQTEQEYLEFQNQQPQLPLEIRDAHKC